MSDFREFISKILGLSGIGPKNIQKLTSDGNLEQFRIAFTHKTVEAGEKNNYELYELVGDSLVNAALLGYVRTTSPEITDVETLTRIKHYIQGRHFLSRLAFQNGFFDHAIIGEEYAQSILSGAEKRGRRFNREQTVMTQETKDKIIELGDSLFDNKTFLKLMTDLFEAVCGVISALVEKEKKVPGVGYVPVYRLTNTLLKRSNIDLSYDEVFDPITRLKETYDGIRYVDSQGNERKWSLMELRSTEKLPDGKYKVTIYGYFGKTRNPEIEKKQILSEAIAKDSGEALKEAAKRGLANLQKYGIYERKKRMGGEKKAQTSRKPVQARGV